MTVFFLLFLRSLFCSLNVPLFTYKILFLFFPLPFVSYTLFLAVGLVFVFNVCLYLFYVKNEGLRTLICSSEHVGVALKNDT